ncbi:MAG: hypothetical protein D3924_05135 [Candidatus Electrothrix sp. AR4]|nr:hypothetical protein [Candidatus Electrothrix sp. AR4]
MHNLLLKTLGLKNLKPGKIPTVEFEIENVGKSNARNIQIETGVYVTSITLDNELFFTQFKSPSTNFLLSKGKVMCESVPFMRLLTADEIKKIVQGDLIVSAYSVIRYEDELHETNKELRSCDTYSAETKNFEKNLCFCIRDDCFQKSQPEANT